MPLNWPFDDEFIELSKAVMAFKSSDIIQLPVENEIGEASRRCQPDSDAKYRLTVPQPKNSTKIQPKCQPEHLNFIQCRRPFPLAQPEQFQCSPSAAPVQFQCSSLNLIITKIQKFKI